jgi:hypothetical protein
MSLRQMPPPENPPEGSSVNTRSSSSMRSWRRWRPQMSRTASVRCTPCTQSVRSAVRRDNPRVCLPCSSPPWRASKGRKVVRGTDALAPRRRAKHLASRPMASMLNGRGATRPSQTGHARGSSRDEGQLDPRCCRETCRPPVRQCLVAPRGACRAHAFYPTRIAHPTPHQVHGAANKPRLSRGSPLSESRKL